MMTCILKSTTHAICIYCSTIDLAWQKSFDMSIQEDHSNSITIGVSDEHIGLVLGRGGRNIMEISQVYKWEIDIIWFHNFCLCSELSSLSLQVSGARIKISDRGDFMSGTTDRYNNPNFINLLLGIKFLANSFSPFTLCDRKVTITGSQRAIHQAESMILQKVANASERMMD